MNIALDTTTNLDLIELNKFLEDNTAPLLNNDSVVRKGII